MSDKITGSDLEKLIKEAMLSERSVKDEEGRPIKVIRGANTRNNIRYEPGYVYNRTNFPTAPEKQGLFDLPDYKTSNSSAKRKSNVFFFGKDEPIDTLQIEDIEKLFIDISFDTKGQLESGNKKYALTFAYKLLSEYGTPKEQATWNNSLAIMVDRNKNFRELFATKSRDVQGSNLAGSDFGFIGNKVVIATMTDEEKAAAYDNSWTAHRSFSSADDRLTTRDRFGDDQVQKKRDLFNIDLRNYGSEVGSFPAEVNAAMTSLFPGQSTLKQRIQKITKFSENMEKLLKRKNPTSQFSNLGLQEMISTLIICDYLNSMLEDVDAGASAYLFEAFCAALAGGRVEGKDKTDEGKMGAVDFTMSNGAAGSSKLYSKTTGIKQAVNGFKSDEVVHYITALKEKSNEQILNITLYTYKVVVERDTGTNYAFVLDPKGNQLGKKQTIPDGGNVKLNKAEYYVPGTKVGTFKLLRTTADELGSFRAAVAKASESITNGLNEVLPKISEIQSDSAEFSQNLNVYAASGESKNGDAAINKLVGLKALTRELFELFNGKTDYQDVETGKLAESKLTPDALKKIIEESFKR